MCYCVRESVEPHLHCERWPEAERFVRRDGCVPEPQALSPRQRVPAKSARLAHTTYAEGQQCAGTVGKPARALAQKSVVAPGASVVAEEERVQDQGQTPPISLLAHRWL